MTDAAVISDPMRVPVVAYARDAGGVVLSRGSRFIALNDAELARLLDFASGMGRLVRHPVL